MAKIKRDQLRFCSDFRHLNSVMVKDAVPIPRIDESFSKLRDLMICTTLDLGWAVWQEPLEKQICFRAKAASVEKDAVWPMQRDKPFSRD